MKNKYYWLIGVIFSITLLLIIFNPTTNDLKSHQKVSPKDKVTIDRKNYFLFSLYTLDGTDGVDFYQYKYVGIMGTFFGRLTMIT